MNKERVIVKQIPITKAGQMSVFDIKVPREVSKIIGIETGLRWISGAIPNQAPFISPIDTLLFQRNITLGDLTLKSFDNAHLFYSEEIKVHRSYGFSDFTAEGFTPMPYTHQALLNEDKISIDGAISIAQGMYKDTFLSADPFAYTVMVYVWLENKLNK
jgi:hypothetical protein